MWFSLLEMSYYIDSKNNIHEEIFIGFGFMVSLVLYITPSNGIPPNGNVI